MKKTANRLLRAVVALAVLALSGVTVLAAPGDNNLPGGAAQDLPFAVEQPGKTTVGVQVSRQDPTALAFEVPLYMTLAVVGDADTDARVVCPTDYTLRSLAPDGVGARIAVTGMTVQGLAGGTWSLSEATPTAANSLSLSIGRLRLPDVAAGNTAFQTVDLKAKDSAFYDMAAQKYAPIPADGTNLAIAAELQAGARTTGNKAAAAQFRCIYTVSLLDTSGNPIGLVYTGPQKTDAET